MAKRLSVVDLLYQFPACELPFHVFLEKSSLLTPRYYSISSSALSVGSNRCSVTVGVVQSPAWSGNGVFEGVCSNYLASRKPGDTVYATLRPTKAGFCLPQDLQKPIIMVGPGTGLAPFMGFLQQRQVQRAAGQQLGAALLFFGCRHPDQDYLYAKELAEYAQNGIVELHTAFSRYQGSKTYVQNLIEQQQDRVWELIEQGAIIYVCGDGSKMEPEVKSTLTEIYQERMRCSPSAAAQWMEQMSVDQHYALDVWAGS